MPLFRDHWTTSSFSVEAFISVQQQRIFVANPIIRICRRDYGFCTHCPRLEFLFAPVSRLESVDLPEPFQPKFAARRRSPSPFQSKVKKASILLIIIVILAIFYKILEEKKILWCSEAGIVFKTRDEISPFRKPARALTKIKKKEYTYFFCRILKLRFFSLKRGQMLYRSCLKIQGIIVIVPLLLLQLFSFITFNLRVVR